LTESDGVHTRGEMQCPLCGGPIDGRDHHHSTCTSCGWSFGAASRDRDDHHEHAGREHGHAHAHGHSHAHGVSISGENWWKAPETLAVAAAGLLAFVGLGLQLGGLRADVYVPVYLASMLLGGYWVAIEAWSTLREGTLGINILVTVAALGAIVLGEYFEGAVLLFLFAVGEALEDYSLDRTRDSVRELLELTPERATLILAGGTQRTIPVQEIAIGQRILVRPGDKVPLDGEVVEGTSEVNQAPITGESVPVEKQVGDPVFAGTINQYGALVVRVTTEYRNTTLARIVQLVERAQSQRASSEQFIDQFSQYYTPAVIGFAVLLWIVPPSFFGEPFIPWFYRGLVALLLGCPCAFVISTPVSIVSGLAAAARNGTLIKGGVYLERIGGVRTVAFDKTGTLTVGEPSVTDIVTARGVNNDELLRLATTAEARSEHHLARAIVQEARDRGVQPGEVSDFEALAGRGIRATMGTTDYFMGSPAFFARELNLMPEDDPHVRSRLEELKKRGATLVFVGTRDRFLGAFAIADRVRPGARRAIERLRCSGVKRIVLLTGDNSSTAASVAAATGITEVHSELLPEEKVELIGELSRRYGTVAMVGDGINDAPALAAADVGIAMGAAGTDTALETADIALMGDDLSKVAFAIALSRSTMQKVRQNIGLAIGIKLVAALLIIPGLLTLWMAVMADVGATVVVSANGMTLLRHGD